MNWLDITLLCLVGLGLIKGLFDGFIKQTVALVALIAGIFFCGKVAVWLREYLIEQNWLPEEWITIVSYALGFLLIIVVLLLAGDLVNRLINATPLGILNHLLGGIFGLLVMTLFLSLLLNFLESVDKGSAIIHNETKIESRFYYPVKEILPTIFPHHLFFLSEE